MKYPAVRTCEEVAGSRKTRVFLADDHRIVRDGLRMILEAEPDMEVVGEAASGGDTVRQVLEMRPDVVVMDISLNEMSGIEATQRIREASSEIHVVMLSMHATTEHIYRALKAGATGYVIKEAAGSEVVQAIRAAKLDKRYMSDRIRDTITDDFIWQRELPAKSPIESLTSREMEILKLVVDGKSSAEIGEILGLSSKTVDTYRWRMMQKLGVGSAAGLVKTAVAHGMT